jgi:hypothetical protein
VERAGKEGGVVQLETRSTTVPATVPATFPAPVPATVPVTIPATVPVTVPATAPATFQQLFHKVETCVESAWFQLLKLSFHELRSEIAFNFYLHRYTKARGAGLAPADYSGANFTISNLGMFKIDCFDAILPPGQAGEY